MPVEVEESSHAMLVSFVYKLYQVAKRAPKTSSNIVQSFSGLELAVFISDRAVALTVDCWGVGTSCGSNLLALLTKLRILRKPHSVSRGPNMPHDT